MPFTFCHPAIILPLTKISKSRISATGLIIGSMAPDFEYFLKMRMEKVHGHSLTGLFYFDLPLTIILAFAFHLFVRDALIMNLPELLKKRLVQFVGLDWITWVKKKWYVLIYSALIGIFSHLFWDAFTHTNGYFVRHIPFLQGSTEVFGVWIKIADLAQMLSSIFGGIFILLVLVWPVKREVPMNVLRRKITYWILVATITFAILLLRNGDGLGDFVATSISGALIGLLITPSLMKLVKLKNNDEPIQ
ncbi:MAG: hypothetical protein ACI8ZM_004056 [Crocinitomix sp.]|jgi:hypothetical protein